MARRDKIKTAADLAEHANPGNPRVISDEQLEMLKDSLERFGDLSGLILNRRTENLIGGHQRVKLLGEAPVTITKTYKKPTKRGTVAEGFVVHDGERFTYRIVDWDEATEQAAMVAANKHGGEWDNYKLKEVLGALREENYDMKLTGFNPAELARILKEPAAPENFTAFDTNLPIQHKCPKCGYAWSGKPDPTK
jgi:ParB-like chromosome segregation protein Spo0J